MILFFSLPEDRRHLRRPRQNQTRLHPRLYPARLEISTAPAQLSIYRASNCTTVTVRWESRQHFRGTSELTSLRSLLVHDTMSAFPAANGLAGLDVIFGTAIFRTSLLTQDFIRDIILLTSTQVLHLLPRRR